MLTNIKYLIKNSIARIIFDYKSEKINKLDQKTLLELLDVLERVRTNMTLKLLIISSKKKDIFIAGADINEIEKIKNETDAIKKVKIGQKIISKLEEIAIPTISIIDGACLGGGLELVLACDYRIATTNPKTILGLPEVNLGIIPGFGGTQRLPRLIGLEQSLKIILSGKSINSRKAFKIGLIDKIIKSEFIDNEIKNFSEYIINNEYNNKILEKRKKLSRKLFIDETLLFKKYLIFYFSKKNILKLSKGHYPAPLSALKVIRNTYNISNIKKGYEIELKAFSELVISNISKNLINLYFISEKIKKSKTNKINKIENLGLLGAGVMGGGIAWLFSNANINVRLKDINREAIALGYKKILEIFNQLVKIGKYKKSEIDFKISKITHSTNYSAFRNSDIVIEAIIEDLEIKQKELKILEEHISKDAIIATNSSALSITEMSKSLKNKERFLGMHFFNPVNRMPLVEIIKGKYTSNDVVEKIRNLSLELRKIPIIVEDSTGFIVNRILIPFINEAGYLLEDGVDIKRIEKIATNFGMPMGPFTLADNVGIDVGYKVADILFNTYGNRMKISYILQEIYKDKKSLGKKTSLGFFKYKNNKSCGINPLVNSIISKTRLDKDLKISDQEIIDRLILIMINEASRCVEEKTIENIEDIDIAMIYGAGFPPFRGGLLRYADQLGSRYIVRELKKFKKKYGEERFTPSNILLKMIKKKDKFI